MAMRPGHFLAIVIPGFAKRFQAFKKRSRDRYFNKSQAPFVVIICRRKEVYKSHLKIVYKLKTSSLIEYKYLFICKSLCSARTREIRLVTVRC